MTPDVMVPSTNQVTRILQQETRTIPIVFAFVGDPVGSGFVASLARPGRNLTGFANFENSIGGKWLELLKEIAPRAGRAGFIFNPDAAPNVGFFHAAQAAAAPLAIKLTGLPVRDAIDIEEGVSAFATEPDCGLNVDAAIRISSRYAAWEALSGFQSRATREAGTPSLRSCNRLLATSGPRMVFPVMFPPGRARLVTSPAPTGSPIPIMTMGIVAVACLAARAGGVP